jgi:putative iron-regulated protein
VEKPGVAGKVAQLPEVRIKLTKRAESRLDTGMRWVGGIAGGVLGILVVGGCGERRSGAGVAPVSPPESVRANGFDPLVGRAVVATYARLVFATYSDSLSEARKLDMALQTLVADPTEANLAAAREAWKRARVPYMQSEAFRFSDGPIDRDRGAVEGLLNAWPMDEAYVDYVEGAPEAGIINMPGEYPEITKELLASLNERDGEANISTGYHAIEFLLWGQDLSADGPGARPVHDYQPGVGKNAARRAKYLLLTSEMLVEHLAGLVREWDPTAGKNYCEEFLAAPVEESVKKIFMGVVTLSQHEVPGERLGAAYATRGQEDEQSCFSDTTHVDMILDVRGIRNVITGQYAETTAVSGTGLGELIAKANPELGAKVMATIDRALAAAEGIPVPFDQAILGDSDKLPGRLAVARLIDDIRYAAQALDESAIMFGMEVPQS